MKSMLFMVAVMAAAFATVARAQDAPQTRPFVSTMFTDHMVLQRGHPIPVWGWAAPGDKVTVTLGAAKATATAGPDGRWMAKLKAFRAGGPYTLAIQGSQTVTLNDVLVGDVWLCSGQSNMEMGVMIAKDAEQEAAAANHPLLRLYTVPDNIATRPVDALPSQWLVCTPENIRKGKWGGFSAAAYYFGRDLQEHLKVPIGLIHSSWGGTPIEAWTSMEALERVPERRAAAMQVHEQAGAVGDAAKQQAEWWRRNDAGSAASPGWEAVGIDTSDWKTMDVPGAWEDAGLPNFDGVAWFRKEVDLPASVAGQVLRLHLGNIDDRDVTWVNGVQVGASDVYNTPRDYAVPAGVAKPGRNVIAVRVLDTGGAGGFVGKAEEMRLDVPGGSLLPLGGAWAYKATADLAKTPYPMPMNNPNLPTVLYNGMIAPVVPFGIKGAIWYQGESNAGQAYLYRTLLPNMMADWRARFGVPDFPFLIVQLANWTERAPQPGESDWAELREAQLMTAQRVPKTGLALAIDIGEAGDIHPKNKQELGRRLALTARHVAYGETLPYSGPVFRSMKAQDNAITLTFDHTDGGLTAKGGALHGFAIAGEDRKFVWADARIEGDTVVVSSPLAPRPVAVRYDWAENPEATLYNGAGLPASPFRTDDWPGVTAPKGK